MVEVDVVVVVVVVVRFAFAIADFLKANLRFGARAARVSSSFCLSD